MTNLPSDYKNRVYAGWLGKCIGVRFGAPLEGWTYHEIAANLGEVKAYLPLPTGTIFKPDDDTALPMLLIRALEDYGPDVTSEQMGKTWLNYLADQHSTLWWGGYGVSTEHTAYLNLASGIPAPQSGSIALNGATLAEQIGGQIFSDIWGLVAPGNPLLAAEYAEKAASVSHDGDGINGARFIAGLISQAFVTDKPDDLIKTALTLVSPQSEYARVVKAVQDFHHQNPENWRVCYHFIEDNFGYNRYAGEVHIIPNTAVVVMAILYGEGNFSKSIQIANMAGWDTDCNVGNVGAIIGVMVGLEGIPASWRDPLNDHFVATGLIGSRNLHDIPATADLFSRLGQTIAKGTRQPLPPRYHFDYPGATHGFVYRNGDKGGVIALKQAQHPAGNGLKIALRKLNKKSESYVFVKTAYRPDELSANYYGASFSPKIYPGQTITTRLYLPAEASAQLLAALYVWDANSSTKQQVIRQTGQILTPGEWHKLEFVIPSMTNAYFTEVGLVLRNLGQPWTGHCLLDYLDWQGDPDFETDFSLERAEFGSISQWTYLRGYWRLTDKGYHGSGVGAGPNETYTGDIKWRNYTVESQFVPLFGHEHWLLVRVQGAHRGYAIGLAADNQLVIYKNKEGYRVVAAIDFPWSLNQSYTLQITAEDNRLTVESHGETLIVWQDNDAPYLHGQIGFANIEAHTRYELLKCRPFRN